MSERLCSGLGSFVQRDSGAGLGSDSVLLGNPCLGRYSVLFALRMPGLSEAFPAAPLDKLSAVLLIASCHLEIVW